MEGKIIKVKESNPESNFNELGNEHIIKFSNKPEIGQRFYVYEETRGFDDADWSTSSVEDIREEDDGALILTTKNSTYKLTITK